MLASFFPLDEASNNDSRFPKPIKAQQGPASVSPTKTIFSWYKRSCTYLSPEVVAVLDGLLTVDQSRRLTVDAVRNLDWILGKSAAPQVVAVSDDDAPVFRGASSSGLESLFLGADMIMDDDDEAPCYRSLQTQLDLDEGLLVPGLMRQKGTFDLHLELT